MPTEYKLVRYSLNRLVISSEVVAEGQFFDPNSQRAARLLTAKHRQLIEEYFSDGESYYCLLYDGSDTEHAERCDRISDLNSTTPLLDEFFELAYEKVHALGLGARTSDAAAAFAAFRIVSDDNFGQVVLEICQNGLTNYPVTVQMGPYRPYELVQRMLAGLLRYEIANADD